MELQTECSSKPRFSLGGQVSTRYSNPSIHFLDDDETPVDMESFQHAASLNSEVLLREFTHDEQATDSPSAGFKSSFAREVVQNVRKSLSLQDQTLSVPNPQYRSQFAASNHDQLLEETPPRRYTQRRVRSSDRSSDEMSDLAMTTRRVRSTDREWIDPAFAMHSDELSGMESEMWMSSTQFIDLMEKQEAAEEVKLPPLRSKSEINIQRIKKTPSRGSGYTSGYQMFRKKEVDNVSSSSFLDKDAKVSISKLKQTCTDLGFDFHDDEWDLLRERLSCTRDEATVRNEDFFAALNDVVKNKLNGRHDGKECLKESSMKSDSGGEMESCRSSDSELERELAEKEREILERERDLANCYRNMAEKETELVRLRLECQRLTDDNRSINEKLEECRLYSNPRKHLILEKEIENLRWELSMVESSRRTYEIATQRLVSFLEQVTSALQTTSPGARKLIESTRAEVSAVARKTARANKRFSLDSQAHMARAESMPGLCSGFGGSSSSLSSSSQVGYATTTLNREPRKPKSRVQRSHSTHSKVPLPSLQENEDVNGNPSNEDSVSKSPTKEKEISPKPPLLPKRTSTKKERAPDRPRKHSTEDSGRSSPGSSCKESIPSSGRSTPLKPVDTSRSSEPIRPEALSESTRPEQPSKPARTGTRRSNEPSQPEPIRARSESKPRSTEGGTKLGKPVVSGPPLEKYKSLTDLGVQDKQLSTNRDHRSLVQPSVSSFSAESMMEDSREQILVKTQKMLRSMKCLLAREKTLTITPKKSKPAKVQRKPTLQLLSHSSFPGLPSYPLLAASRSSPWNC